MKDHWEAVYQKKRPEEVSWFQPHLNVSLALLERAGLRSDSAVIDVGGGTSTLVDDLLARGVQRPTVLDISHAALAAAKARLGAKAAEAEWIEADIRQAPLPQSAYDLWHDRAVFHFLVNAEDRQQYLRTMKTALKSNGHVVIATFSLQGPPRCSGLDVTRYSADTLQSELGDAFQLMEVAEEAHRTPSGMVQQFVYFRFKRGTG